MSNNITIHIEPQPIQTANVNILSSPPPKFSIGIDNPISYWAEIAKMWAIKMDGKVFDEDYSAKYYANQSIEGATTASAKADIAIAQANIALTQAGIATTKAGEASTSATNAATSAELARQYAQMYSHVLISTEEPSDDSVDVLINPEGEATQVGSALSINGRSLSLLSDEDEVMSTITLPEGGLVDDVKVNNVSVVTNKIANIDLTGYQPVGDYATNTALTQGLATKQDTIPDLENIKTGAYLGATSVQPSDISDMATQTWVGQQGYITSSSIAGKEDTSNKVSSISSSSTDTQYPSAKCVYDIVGNIESLLHEVNSGN